MTTSRAGDLFQPGDLVNNTYRIEAILGRGGTSDVYRARSEISGRLAALKVLKAEFSSNDDYLVLLTREEEIRDIRHDAVVRYSENNRTGDGHVYLVMDYVDGPGLDAKLKAGPMPADALMTICRRVCEGLEAAHARNIVHRDLSPDNIILRDGDPAQAVIIDFGIAKDTNPGAETIVGNEFAGKYAYAAPEQMSGKTDHRTDIYSLGALLLACFRGAPPEIGRNPMEVVENKKKPLDTAGVPEPLKSVIDRMCAPDPADRFQSTTEVLAALAGRGPAAPPAPAAADAGNLEDATVIVPRPGAGTRDSAAPKPAAGKPGAGRGKAKAQSGSRGGLYAVIAVVLLAAAGGGAWFIGVLDGLFGPSYPEARPYTLVAEKREGLPPRVTGYAPSEQTRDGLASILADQDGSVDLTLASGDISPEWGDGVTGIVKAVSQLDEWRLSITGNEARLTGRTTDEGVHDRVNAAFAAGLPGGLQGAPEITLDPLFLDSADLRPVLNAVADCGPLELRSIPPSGYGPDREIEVTGTLASEASLTALRSALAGLAGGRPLELDIDVLNPTLCLIENFLPSAPPGDVGIQFRNGEKGNAVNPSGDFMVGENPVIDVVLPRDVQNGYLSVSVLDVSGNVFHLLPNISRKENDISSIRAGDQGPMSIRVAYSVAESAENGGLAFQVDDSTLGKSKVIAIHSDAPLFTSMRPTTESASGYAEALRDSARSQETRILSLDSRILTTLAR
ncbi:serine/threonine protein kinase [Cribrihabitans marinus]|uniref:Serine/threonine protein kinase n=1 Tax=Cribrihabitans marinus TaxID=1227549 RepID=A0A1H7DMX6_9RHOB|nr:serine/threonine protein kinase [Cribrihabitans marinus]SEK03161.1 serine/threonine protein kinase [Cribrihabitans marinus]